MTTWEVSSSLLLQLRNKIILYLRRSYFFAILLLIPQQTKIKYHTFIKFVFNNEKNFILFFNFSFPPNRDRLDRREYYNDSKRCYKYWDGLLRMGISKDLLCACGFEGKNNSDGNLKF